MAKQGDIGTANVCAQVGPDEPALARERPSLVELIAWAERLLAQLSHDVRNPLASLASGLYLLSLDQGLSAENRAIVTSCRAECQRMTTRMNDAVRLLRRREIVPNRCLLNEIVELSLDERRAATSSAGIVLEGGAGPEPCEVIGDARALSEAIGRLLDDAIASARGGRVAVVLGRLSPEESLRRFPAGDEGVLSLRFGGGEATLPMTSQTFNPMAVPGRPARGIELAQALTLVEFHGGMVLPLQQTGIAAGYEILLPAGDRPGCWAWKGDRREPTCGPCVECPTNQSPLGACCWAGRGRASYDRTDAWPLTCRGCSYFQHFHLLGRAAHGEGI